nr:MAG TPA: hypothetical protein [Caudoviricetes sp.]
MRQRRAFCSIYKSNSLPSSQVESPAATYSPDKPKSLGFIKPYSLLRHLPGALYSLNFGQVKNFEP